MRILYIIPGPMHLTELGVTEMKRREGKLRDWAFQGTQVDLVAVDRGPASIESMFEEYLSIQPTAEKVKEAEANGYDAAIIGCFGDPGLDGLREISDMLVVGPARASIALATTLGHRFSFVTVTETIVPGLRRLAWESGALDSMASVRFIDTPVIELNKNHAAAVGKMIEEGRKAVKEDRADVLVLGCMSMGFLDVAEEMSRELGVPVVNPSKAALKVAEATVAMGLKHSRRAYMIPPKIAAGKRLEELFVLPSK